MKDCFLSPAKPWFKHTNASLAVVITTGQIYFQPFFQSLSHRLHQSIYWSHTDFQYMAAASIALTKLPFCYNNSPDRYSINVSAHRLFTCLCYTKWELHPGNMSDPLFKAVCVAGPSSEPCIHAGLGCTACHPQIQYYRSVIQFPALSANWKKKESRFKLHSPVLSSAGTDNCTFTSSSFFDCDSR